MNEVKDLQKSCATVKRETVKKEKGASMVEYALLVALIAVIAILAIKALGQKVSQQFSHVGSVM